MQQKNVGTSGANPDFLIEIAYLYKMSLEARKLSILEHLVEINDEEIILQIENLIKPKVDFWDQLPGSHKQVIQKGIKSLDEGKRVDYKTVKARFNR